MSTIQHIIWLIFFWPTEFLQPSYIEPDAVIVVAFVQLIWFGFLGLVSLWILFSIAKKFDK